MPGLKFKLPKYSKHKATGQAVVRLDGRDHYLGKYGTPKSQERYRQLIAEWAARKNVPTARTCHQPAVREDLRICELLVAYLEFADGYYRKNGQPTGEVSNVKDAVRPLGELYRDAKVAEFGPAKLKAVREAMVDPAGQAEAHRRS